MVEGGACGGGKEGKRSPSGCMEDLGARGTTPYSNGATSRVGRAKVFAHHVLLSIKYG
jgi:hypothetical protein